MPVLQAVSTLTQQNAAMDANALVLGENIAQLKEQLKASHREHDEARCLWPILIIISHV